VRPRLVASLAFSIGGKLFPVDPRDFINQASDNELTNCAPNVVQTDAPVEGQGYQYSWSLGDPFLKSVLATFYYGNITYPSVDPPCIGLMSTVPADAGTQLKSVIASAIKDNGANEFTTSTPAPTGVPVAGISGGGVPLAPVGKLGGSDNTNDATSRGRTPWFGLLAVLLSGGLIGLI